jgi:hypothetical protein
LPTKDPRVPQELKGDEVGFECVGRDESFTKFYGFVTTRYLKRDAAANPSDKALNLLPGLQSSRGGGKSFFLSEMAQLAPKDIDRYWDSTLTLPNNAVAKTPAEQQNALETRRKWRQAEKIKCDIRIAAYGKSQTSATGVWQHAADKKLLQEFADEEGEDKLLLAKKNNQQQDKQRDVQQPDEQQRDEQQRDEQQRDEQQRDEQKRDEQQRDEQQRDEQQRDEQQRDEQQRDEQQRDEQQWGKQWNTITLQRASRKAKLILRTSVAVCITFNSNTGLGPHDTSASIALGVRMLYSTFIDQSACTFANFVRACRDTLLRMPEYADALACIQARVSPNVLLCVDELIKLSPSGDIKDKIIMTALSLIGTTLSDDEHFNALISTLDIGPMKLFQSDSSRHIFYIPLPPLPQEDAAQLVLRKSKIPDSALPAARLVMSDQNGHPKSLEVTCLYFNSSPMAVIEGDYNRMIADISRDTFFLDSVDLITIKAALAGRPLKLDQEIGVRRLGSLIASGTYMNTLSSLQDVTDTIPLVTPLVLRRYADMRSSTDAAELFVKKCLYRMLGIHMLLLL